MELMKQQGLSYRSLEEKTGISRSVLQRRVSKNPSHLNIKEIEKIATAFNKTPQELLSWGEDAARKHKDNTTDELQESYKSLSPIEIEKVDEFIKFLISLRK